MLPLLLLAVGLAGWQTYRKAVSEFNDLLDDGLKQVALTLRDAGAGTVTPPSFRNSRIQSNGSDDSDDVEILAQIWLVDGGLVWSSAQDAEVPLARKAGKSKFEANGQRWRIYRLDADDGRIIQVAQDQREREKAIWKSLKRSAMPLLSLIPAVILLCLGVTWWGLRPLRRLAYALYARGPDSLQAFPVDRVPAEVQPLVAAMNVLMLRLQEALSFQRQLTANAAHELRTPLAALRLQLDVVELTADAADRHAAIAELRQGVARATRLVQQLLDMARSDAGMASSFGRLGLADVIRDVVQQLQPQAQARGIVLQSDLESVQVSGDADSLSMLLSNLIDNALRYAPAASTVQIVLKTENDRPVLRVIDEGPGIHPQERERVFERFYRTPGTPGLGSGIGLSIVRDIAVRHRADITIGAGPTGGACIALEFPK
ncbi:ATP-binding protein [Herbaspirillum sp. CF444]|uniref:ATP-binding protein n=1 Tax=Herbaspirillum sp. CF444 TaxID=1144319 RepID=UPI00138B0F26|nr:ATP-binding protein [Herbaspirillum sp. CF444]